MARGQIRGEAWRTHSCSLSVLHKLLFSCSKIIQYSLDYRKGFPTNNYPRCGCLQICFHKFKVTDFLVGFYVINGRRQGFIVACASHQKKDRHGSPVKFDSRSVLFIDRSVYYSFLFSFNSRKVLFFCIDIFFSVAMTKTLNQHLKQWQPTPTVSSLSLNSVRIVSRYI